jgi:hypothetical protein
MARIARRRYWVVSLCLAFAAALTVQAMLSAAMAGPAPHAMHAGAPMADGCEGCGDGAKADGACVMAPCGTMIGVLADAPLVDRRPAASHTPPTDRNSASLTTDPDPLPPRR